MDDNKLIQNLRTLPLYNAAMEKLTVAPTQLDENEKTFLLTVAIILLRKYERDNRLTSFVELAYFIILKYSLSFNDFAPLYDFSVNIGYYPIARAITDFGQIQINNIASAIIPALIDDGYKRETIIETYGQKHTRDQILSSTSKDICYIAPTSFGKSSIILEHIATHWETFKRVAVIVPTKSLLMQSYRDIRHKGFDAKIIIHDEMYNNEERFIAVLTQERALRLLDKHDIFFDCLYIDEAHRLLERDSRSILLSRLIRLNRQRSEESEVIYLSPLVTDTNNLKTDESQEIFEQRIKFNIKEPELFEYCTDGTVQKYNRFIDTFFPIGHSETMFRYINQNATEKTFCYLYAPKKIEQFAEEFSRLITTLQDSPALKEVIKNLKEYVHDEFYAIDYIKKGIIYLHGKMPDNVKEYLEYKYSQIPELQFIIANKVILEGINLPISSLFVLNGTNLYGKDLTNLIGRVNRLNLVFSKPPNLELLMPQVHFVNSEEYNRRRGNFENKIRLLRSSVFADNVKNPTLENFDIENKENKNNADKCKEIVENESIFFAVAEDSVQELKRRMISLGMNTIYTISDELCQTILEKIDRIKDHPKLHEGHFLDRLRYLFIRHCDGSIVDEEFARLKNDKAIAYYKMFFKNRKMSLKENVAREVAYFQRRIADGDSLMYIGESYGEQAYATTGREVYHNVYIDLSRKSSRQLANIAIVKQKIEEDFVSFKLRMFFQLMLDYSILSEDEYYEILYGTTNRKKIYLVKTGLTINLINRLEKDDQLKNITFDRNGNLITNDLFGVYLNGADDFYRFELSRFL